MRELNDSETTTIIYISIFTIFFISLISCMGYKYDRKRNFNNSFSVELLNVDLKLN